MASAVRWQQDPLHPLGVERDGVSRALRLDVEVGRWQSMMASNSPAVMTPASFKSNMCQWPGRAQRSGDLASAGLSCEASQRLLVEPPSQRTRA